MCDRKVKCSTRKKASSDNGSVTSESDVEYEKLFTITMNSSVSEPAGEDGSADDSGVDYATEFMPPSANEPNPELSQAQVGVKIWVHLIIFEIESWIKATITAKYEDVEENKTTFRIEYDNINRIQTKDLTKLQWKLDEADVQNIPQNADNDNGHNSRTARMLRRRR